MAQETPTKQEQKTPTAAELDKKEGRGRVADYLQGPRKRRRSYVIGALSPATTHFFSGIDAFVKSQFKNTIVSQPKTVEELVKNFNRQVVLLLIDDEFSRRDECLRLVGELKQKKTNSVVPALFLTRQPEELVARYHEILLPFHESDDLLDWSRADIRHIFAKIRDGVGQKFARRSRRYKIDIPLRFSMISDSRIHPGHLLDLSLHGALLRSADQGIFRPSEQIKLFLPTMGLIPGYAEEFLRLSCRVRRIFISGTHVGVSFEHLSDQMNLYLLTFLTNLVTKTMPIKGNVPLINPAGNLV